MESPSEMEYELPTECWEMIASFLQPHHLESLSLVNKLFLSITNSLRTFFSSSISSTIHPPSLLRRFPNITSLSLRTDHNTPSSLLPLLLPNLTSLSLPDSKCFPIPDIPGPFPRLKTLLLPRSYILDDNHLFRISLCFPSLEELDVSYPCASSLTDCGLLRSLPKLKRMSKIDLSGNTLISDVVIDSLSSNCAELREIRVKDCFLVSEKGIAELVRNRPDLEGLHLSDLSYLAAPLEVIQGFRFSRELKCLGLSSSFVSDDLLGVLAEVNLPSRELVLSNSEGFTFRGLLELLMNCREIEILDLKGVSFLSDDHVALLGPVLRNLVSVDFSECRGLTHGILYSLAKSCPRLREIRMDRLFNKSELWMDPFPGNENANIVVNQALNFLRLTKDSTLNDNFLKEISHMFPNLQYLDVSNCGKITAEGLSTVLKACSKILHLNISLCSGIRSFPTGKDVLNLEVLVAQEVRFDCHDLGVIGRRCPRLRHIDLKNCHGVRIQGVKQLVISCKLLREVSLRWCFNVDVEVVVWLIGQRRSIRRIDPPKGSALSRNQINFYCGMDVT